MPFKKIFLSFFLPLLFAAPPVSRAIEPKIDYYLSDFFNLYKFIEPPYLPIYENRDLSRLLLPQRIIEDNRYKDACTSGSECKGDVTIETEQSPGNWVPHTINDTGNCVIVEGATSGFCDYTNRPSNAAAVTSIDYSKIEDIVFPKLQNTAFRYDYTGSDNSVSWGAHNLSLSRQDLSYRRAITLAQAWQTQDVVASTGQWPLGGVNYEAPLPPVPITYNPNNPICIPEAPPAPGTEEPALIDVWGALDGSTEGKTIKSNGIILLELWKQMVKPPNITSPQEQQEYDEAQVVYASAMQAIDEAVSAAGSKSPPPTWLSLFERVPECGPGYDKGYVLVSVCAREDCTPISNAMSEPVTENPSFRAQTVYADTRSRQNLCSAVYEMYQTFSLQESLGNISLARKINPLFSYTLLSDSTAIPENIDKQLLPSSNSIAKSGVFSLPWLHKVLDGWWVSFNNFWYTKLGYSIQSGLEKREAGAIQEVGVLGVIKNAISAIYYLAIDTIFPRLYHTVVIPSPSAISITSLEEAVYSTRESAENVAADSGATQNYSNVVDSDTEKLIAGNPSAPKLSQRIFAIYACIDSFFSDSWKTSVTEYKDGIRQACAENQAGLLGYFCKGEVVPAADPACKICNIDKSPYFKSLGYDSLPQSMIDIIETAAEEYKVPGSLILGILISEGGFQREQCYGKWSDNLVLQSSACKGEIPQCHTCNVSSAGAVGPYQFIPYWWDSDPIFKDLGKPCNFFDATMATAISLARGRIGLSQWGPYWPDKGCTVNGTYIPYTPAGYLPNSCSDWTTQDIVTAARAHRGACDPEYFARVLDAKASYTCGQ